MAERLVLDYSEAESLKRSAGDGRGRDAGPLVEEMDPLVAEIESSLAFFATQLDGGRFEETLLTGGGARNAQFVEQLASRLPGDVEILDPFAEIDLSGLDLEPDRRQAAASSGLLALGAARWAFDAPSRRLSLLPTEIAAAAATRRKIVVAAIGVAVVAGALGLTGFERTHEVRTAQSAEGAAKAANQRTSEQITQLQPVSQVETAIASRSSILQSAESTDVAWTPLLEQITAAMPPGTKLTALSFSDPSGTGTSGASSSAAAATSAAAPGGAGPLGSVSMSVTGPASEEQVAVWLRALRHVAGLEGVWVPSASVGGGKVTFTSTGGLSVGVPTVDRRTVHGSA